MADFVNENTNQHSEQLTRAHLSGRARALEGIQLGLGEPVFEGVTCKWAATVNDDADYPLYFVPAFFVLMAGYTNFDASTYSLLWPEGIENSALWCVPDTRTVNGAWPLSPLHGARAKREREREREKLKERERVCVRL